MLVLSRKPSETIVIDCGAIGLITVTVVQIDYGKVRLGFDAPREVPVHRSEVWEAIQRQRERDRA